MALMNWGMGLTYTSASWLRCSAPGVTVGERCCCCLAGVEVAKLRPWRSNKELGLEAARLKMAWAGKAWSHQPHTMVIIVPADWTGRLELTPGLGLNHNGNATPFPKSSCPRLAAALCCPVPQPLEKLHRDNTQLPKPTDNGAPAIHSAVSLQLGTLCRLCQCPQVRPASHLSITRRQEGTMHTELCRQGHSGGRHGDCEWEQGRWHAGEHACKFGPTKHGISCKHRFLLLTVGLAQCYQIRDAVGNEYGRPQDVAGEQRTVFTSHDDAAFDVCFENLLTGCTYSPRCPPQAPTHPHKSSQC